MKKWIIILITGLSLGLSWAIRGHFGHWWGASWAGGIAAIALVLAIGKKEWIKRLPVLALLSAIGWGFGGIMSYGILVGYCRSVDIFNSAYGYAMLFIVGGLYGFVGGGLFGLGLSSDENKKPDWIRLLLEMFVIGYLAYWFIIVEMEWLMTPPRDESWAICLGSASALAWYLYRNGNINALRVAIYSALGGGLGFSLGNFFQTLGSTSGIAYNWWNVMEFTLGLLGGIGMAYGVLSSNWKENIAPSKRANWNSLLIIVFIIPAINIFQSFETKKIIELAERISIADKLQFAFATQIKVWVILILFTLLLLYSWKRLNEDVESRKWGIILLSLYLLLYMIFGNIRTGFCYSKSFLGNSVTMYWVIFPIIIFLLIKRRDSLIFTKSITMLGIWKYWTLVLIGIIVLLFFFAIISSLNHGIIPGAHNRF
jgi:hypothetical protein